ncbi:hypothetical protein BASA83_012879 [Batrachochytrium salamandrivorans]|nr:hypothetical protein BASA83_012879 [Batrachochytrium salamandrivorans]
MDDSALASWLTDALAEQMDDEDDEDDDLSESRPIKDQVDTSNRDDDSVRVSPAKIQLSFWLHQQMFQTDMVDERMVLTFQRNMQFATAVLSLLCNMNQSDHVIFRGSSNPGDWTTNLK